MWRMDSKGWKLAESEFFVSLGHVCDHFGLPIPDVSGITYPQNAAAAFSQLKILLELKESNRTCLIIRDERHRATLAVTHRYNTGNCLYYIPVRPLWNILHTAKLQPLAEMLMSVYAYLYRVARIPFYSDDGEYLRSEYEMLHDWVLDMDEGDEEERAEKDERLKEMELLLSAGEAIAASLGQEHWLENFQSNVEAFNASGLGDSAFAALAEDCLRLYRAYSERSLFTNIRLDFFTPDEEDVRIYGEMYISFYWSALDRFYDNLFNMVNNELQECGDMEEPLIMQIFDRPQTEEDRIDFDFERRVFTLLDRLCEIMHDKGAQYDYDTPPETEPNTSI